MRAANVDGWYHLSAEEARARGISPSSKPVLNPQGEVVPYRQLLNAQAQQSGWRNFAQAPRVMKERRREITLETGKLPKDLDRQSAEYRALLKERKEGFQLGGDLLRKWRAAILGPDGETSLTRQQQSSAPGSPLAVYLEALGVRPRNAVYAVGDTP